MVIRIPIEVQTSESTEIRELLDRISEADTKLSNIRTSPPPNQATAGGRAEATALLQGEGGATGIQRDTSRTSRSALGTAEQARTSPIGTPLGSGQDPALPRSGVTGNVLPGGGSPDDLVKQNQFKQLQEQTAGIEERFAQIQGIGGQALGLGLLARGGVGGAIKSLTTGPLSKIIPPLLLIGLSDQIIKVVFEELFRVGGPFDRRFKRAIENEFDRLRSREDKGLLQAGLKEIRVSTGPIGKRATSQGFGQTLTSVKNGIFDEQQGELSFAAIGER